MTSIDARLLTLSRRQCLQRLGSAGRGRLSFHGVAGTTAVAAPYEIGENSAIVGPLPLDTVRAMSAQQLVLFQVDQADMETQQGWTVVVVDRLSPARYLWLGLQSLAGRSISAG